MALDADSKLLISYRVGNRGPKECRAFIEDVASRLANRVQLSTDGLHFYLDAIQRAFGIDIDFAQIIKYYGGTSGVDSPAAVRYSPGNFVSATMETITGDPVRKHI